MAFNPIKEMVGGKKAEAVQWTSKIIKQALDGIDKGLPLAVNPFYEKNTKLLKPDLLYKRTPEEIREWKKCAKDIIYFANTYCKLMTPDGIQHVQLRDYQENYLRHLQSNRLSIMLSARQSGKCVFFISKIQVKLDFNCLDVNINKFSNYCLSNNEYLLPMYEIWNLFDHTRKWKIEYRIYKLLDKLLCREEKLRIKQNPRPTGNIIKHWNRIFHKKNARILLIILEFLDRFEKSDEKIIQSFEISGIEVLSDSGYIPVTHIHKTKPFLIYHIITESHDLYCADKHICFDENLNEKWIQDFQPGNLIMTETGPEKIIEIKIFNRKVCMCDMTVNSPDHRYYTNGILSHNTTTSAIFMLWYIIFNTDKNAMVLGNKRDTAVEILKKTKDIFYELPYFLKPGVRVWNEGKISLDNGCMIIAEATTARSGIGYTLHCVLLDEFAHITPNIQEPFYKNIFPTISAGRARLMITSTQNGLELFSKIYTAAVKGENEYAPFKVDWDQVPEWDPDRRIWYKRDAAWKQMQIGNLGSEEAFNEQFGTEFSSASNALISKKKLNECAKNTVEFVIKDMPGCFNDSFYWAPDIDIYDLRNMFIVATTDISEGIGGDYTIQMFNQLIGVSEDNEPITRTIGYFRSNTLDDKECCSRLSEFYKNYLDRDKFLISIEYNLYGELWIDKLRDQWVSNIIKYYNDDNLDKYKLGVRITKASKNKMCKLFKTAFEKGYIINDDVRFMLELKNFALSGSSYEASFGHDDMVMAQAQLVLAEESLQFKYLREEFEDKNGITNEKYVNYYEAMGPALPKGQYGLMERASMYLRMGGSPMSGELLY